MRELSPFFAKELLSAYLEGSLDKERQNAIEESLAKNADLKALFQKMKIQKDFLEKLSKITPRAELLSFIDSPVPGMKSKLQKYSWKKMSSTTQWSVQLFVIGVLVVTTVRYFPWLNMARVIQRAQPTAPLLKRAVPIEDDMEALKARPTYGPEWPKSFPSPELYAQQLEESRKKNQAIADIVTRTDEEVVQSSNDTEESEEAAPQRQGFVWRGTIKVDELDEESTGKITEIVVSLGGKKAGQVELGWKKGDSRYYHFTMPEANYTEFEQRLGDIGHVTLKKEKHPRVMPEGQMRVIMSVEASK